MYGASPAEHAPDGLRSVTGRRIGSVTRQISAANAVERSPLINLQRPPQSDQSCVSMAGLLSTRGLPGWVVSLAVV
jgi:hypothetical protein